MIKGIAGYVYGDSTSGQTVFYELGLSGIPIYNVNNNCATGASAINVAKRFLETAGESPKCILVVGFEQMKSSRLENLQSDRTPPPHRHFKAMDKLGISTERLSESMNPTTERVLKVYAAAAQEYMNIYKVPKKVFAEVAYKNHRQSVANEWALVREEFSLDEILDSFSLIEPITMAMSAPLSTGAAALVICNEAFVKKHGLSHQAVEIAGQGIQTDKSDTFETSDRLTCLMNLCGYDISRRAADEAFAQARITRDEVGVFEIHDAFASNELMMYEALGLCAPGRAQKLICSGYWDKNLMVLNDRWVINPSGGLESKGHPIGATGVAQCVELCLQLRQMARDRQVSPPPRYAVAHNYGWASIAIVTILKAPTTTSRL